MVDLNFQKAIIKGAFGEGNLGDDALMMASYEILAQVFPKESIFVHGSKSSYIRGLIPKANIVSDISQLKESILYLYGGGTHFFSFELTKTTRAEYWKDRFYRDLTLPMNIIHYLKKKTKRGSEPNISYAAIGIGGGV